MILILVQFAATCMCQTNNGKIKINDMILNLESTFDEHKLNGNGNCSLSYPNGNQFLEVNFTDGKLYGLMTIWDKNGIKVADAFFRNDTLLGGSNTYYKNGDIASKMFFNMNVQDNISWRYYENEKIMEAIEYCNGKPFGIYKSWYESVVLAFEGCCTGKDQYEGSFALYHENGEIALSGYCKDNTFYKKDMLTPYNGECHVFYNTGIMAIRINFVDGKIHDKLEKWYSNKKLLLVKNMKHGMLHGETVYYTNNGDILSKEVYKNGTNLMGNPCDRFIKLSELLKEKCDVK